MQENNTKIKHNNFIISGLTGTGKTILLDKIVEDNMSNYSIVIIEEENIDKILNDLDTNNLEKTFLIIDDSITTLSNAKLETVEKLLNIMEDKDNNVKVGLTIHNAKHLNLIKNNIFCNRIEKMNFVNFKTMKNNNIHSVDMVA